jgi:thiol-disulfide isomerase/thioredoxin
VRLTRIEFCHEACIVVTSKVKPTQDPRQAWVLGGVAIGLILFFGLVILPYVDPGATRGKEASDFSLEVIHGGEAGNRIRLSDLRGNVVVLDFWASWCQPCREQAPIVDSIAKKFEAEDVVVVGVNTGDRRQLALEFLKKHPVSYASVIDTDGSAGDAFGVSKLPTIVILDRAGKVTYSAAQVVNERMLNELVSAALESSG